MIELTRKHNDGRIVLTLGKASVSMRSTGDGFFALDFAGTDHPRKWGRLGIALESAARAVLEGAAPEEAVEQEEFIPGVFSGENLPTEVAVVQKRIHVRFQEEEAEYPEEVRLKLNATGSLTVAGHIKTGIQGMELLGALLLHAACAEQVWMGLPTHDTVLVAVTSLLHLCPPLPNE